MNLQLEFKLQMNLHLTGQNELPDRTHAFLHHPILHRQEQHTLLEKRHDKSLGTTEDIFALSKRVKSFPRSIKPSRPNKHI